MPLSPSAIPPQPVENAPAVAARESPEALALLAARRSTPIAKLGAPGPDPETLREIARLASRTPDHGKLGPWRFVAIAGEARSRLGRALAEVVANDPGMDAQRLDFEAARFLRAPACLMVVSTAAPHAKIPEWEQVLSAGAVCFAALLAGHALGYAGAWLTEWPTYDPRAASPLGLDPHERVAGFVYFGTATEPAMERVRPPFEPRFSVA